MLRRSLVSIGRRAQRPGETATRRRDAASTTTTATEIMEDKTKLKTMDDLGGPTFLTTLHWLFVKGYFQTTQQMQVSVCVCMYMYVFMCVCVFPILVI